MEDIGGTKRRENLVSQIDGAVKLIREKASDIKDIEVKEIVLGIQNLFEGIIQMENWDLYRTAEVRNLASPAFYYLQELQASSKPDADFLKEMNETIQDHNRRLEEMLKNPEFAGRHEEHRE